MSEILEGSHQAYSNTLALFHTPPTDTGIENTEFMEIRPVGVITNGNSLEFNISGNSTRYVDLKRTRLRVKARILKESGIPVTDDDFVGFSNNALHTIFRQCDVSLQQNKISPGVNGNYPYKAMIDLLLSKKQGPQSRYEAQLYYKDTAAAFDDPEPVTGSNTGLYNRYVFTKDGKIVDLEGELYSDICQQDRLIPNGVQIIITLWPQRDSFSLTSGTRGGYRVDIVDAILRVCYVKLNPSILISHSETFLKRKALYPFPRSEIKCHTIGKGQYELSIEDLFSGNCPNRLIVGLVSSAAYAGDYTRSPFSFNHFNCNYVGFSIDNCSVPGKPLEPNYSAGNYIDSFLSVYAAGRRGQDESEFEFSRVEYPNGFCLYGFNVTQELNRECLAVIRRGQTKLDLKFNQPLEEGVTVICYGSFTGFMQIDAARSVSVD